MKALNEGDKKTVILN
ncbi:MULTISPECIES: hypothetical protein [Bacillus]|nr:hypothetical protein [Bacillus wiedmannii]MCU5515255.1 hypothetical protein [Bacillus wiedmannii]